MNEDKTCENSGIKYICLKEDSSCVSDKYPKVIPCNPKITHRYGSCKFFSFFL